MTFVDQLVVARIGAVDAAIAPGNRRVSSGVSKAEYAGIRCAGNGQQDQCANDLHRSHDSFSCLPPVYVIPLIAKKINQLGSKVGYVTS